MADLFSVYIHFNGGNHQFSRFGTLMSR